MTPRDADTGGAVAWRSARGAAVKGAILLLPFLLACSRSPSSTGGATDGETAPELVLDGVSVRHVAADGVQGTIEARRATYSLSDKVVAAEDVIVKFPSVKGDARVDAPVAEWGTEKGLLRFPAGAKATLGGAFRATLTRGEADLLSRVLRGAGGATLEGPGFSVTGSDLTWDLRSGKGDLSAPHARIAPSFVARKG